MLKTLSKYASVEEFIGVIVIIAIIAGAGYVGWTAGEKASRCPKCGHRPAFTSNP